MSLKMKKIFLLLLFISNCFSIDVKDIAETKAQKELRLPQTQNEQVLLDQVIGFTALHHAAYEGKDEIIKLLLISNADTSIKNSDNETAKQLSEELYRQNVCELFEEFEKNGKELIKAASEGDSKKVAEILKN